MWYKNNLLYNAAELPMYWRATTKKKSTLIKDWRIRKHRFGPHRKQYALRVVHKNWDTSLNRPIALYFHGGAWTFGTPEDFLPAARLFIEAGYEVLLPSYRRLPLHNFKHIYEDLLAVRDQLLKNRRVEIVAGMSAGGHLAAFTGWRAAFWSDAKLESPTKMILCGAVINFKEMNLSAGLRLLAGSPNSDLSKFADPIQQLAQSTKVPTQQLLVHGTFDAMVSFHQQHSYFVSQKEKSPGIMTHYIPGGTHLDSCRWMYQDDEVAERIRKFLSQ